MRLVKSRLPRQVLDSKHHESAPAREDLVPVVAQIKRLVVNQCIDIEPDILPWLRSKIQSVSCVHIAKKAARWRR